MRAINGPNPNATIRPSRKSLLFAAPLVLVCAVSAAALTPATHVVANSDPHRMFAGTAPFDLPASFCGFPVHVGIDVNKEYESVSTAPDGSTVIKVTGSLVVSVTNESTGKTITANAAGPGTTTILPNSSLGSVSVEGVGLLYAANGTEVGLPSDLVVTSGPVAFSANFATDTITGGLTHQPHVLLDVCAALS